MDATVERLITYISKINYDNLPIEVVDETKKFILDTIGVGLAGVREPGCKAFIMGIGFHRLRLHLQTAF